MKQEAERHRFILPKGGCGREHLRVEHFRLGLHLVHDTLTGARQQGVEEDQPPDVATGCRERDDEAGDGMPQQHEVGEAGERLMDDLGTPDGPGCHVIGREIDSGGSVPSCLQLRQDGIPAPSTQAPTMYKTEGTHAEPQPASK